MNKGVAKTKLGQRTDEVGEKESECDSPEIGGSQYIG